MSSRMVLKRVVSRGAVCVDFSGRKYHVKNPSTVRMLFVPRDIASVLRLILGHLCIMGLLPQPQLNVPVICVKIQLYLKSVT